jgi:hypothetical protein
MNILLWVLQILAALLHGASGGMKVFMFDKISEDVRSFASASPRTPREAAFSPAPGEAGSTSSPPRCDCPGLGLVKVVILSYSSCYPFRPARSQSQHFSVDLSPIAADTGLDE